MTKIAFFRLEIGTPAAVRGRIDFKAKIDNFFKFEIGAFVAVLSNVANAAIVRIMSPCHKSNYFFACENLIIMRTYKMIGYQPQTIELLNLGVKLLPSSKGIKCFINEDKTKIFLEIKTESDVKVISVDTDNKESNDLLSLEKVLVEKKF
ncbi:hypothetical protein [Rodentibacter caecimuris]|uniref:hypothetical protein n=1 Tax=Rodentibacter caecimuris TaxID=1796644 RepID=UPI00211A29D3|nr:hypothetical protein [Rodentibacter heylii]MCQ9122787.1 hypothetical protein [Rodentibacter heylii]